MCLFIVQKKNKRKIKENQYKIRKIKEKKKKIVSVPMFHNTLLCMSLKTLNRYDSSALM